MKKNKELGRIWDPVSKLVFRSSEDRVVIGKYSDNQLNPITEKDKALCRSLGLKYDQEEVEEAVEEIEEDVEEEVVEEEEVEEDEEEEVEETNEDTEEDVKNEETEKVNKVEKENVTHDPGESNVKNSLTDLLDKNDIVQIISRQVSIRDKKIAQLTDDLENKTKELNRLGEKMKKFKALLE